MSERVLTCGNIDRFVSERVLTCGNIDRFVSERVLASVMSARCAVFINENASLIAIVNILISDSHARIWIMSEVLDQCVASGYSTLESSSSVQRCCL